MEQNVKKRTYPTLLRKGLKFVMDFLDFWIDDYLVNIKGYLNINSAIPYLQMTMNDGENYHEHNRSTLLNNEDAFISSDIYFDYYQNDTMNDDRKDEVLDYSGEGDNNDLISVSGNENDGNVRKAREEDEKTSSKKVEPSATIATVQKVSSSSSVPKESESLSIERDSQSEEPSLTSARVQQVPSPSMPKESESLSIATDSNREEHSKAEKVSLTSVPKEITATDSKSEKRGATSSVVIPKKLGRLKLLKKVKESQSNQHMAVKNVSMKIPSPLKKQDKKKTSSASTNILASSFMNQCLQNSGRDRVLPTENTIKLGTISNPTGTNQCYSIAVFQLFLGMNKFWFYVELLLKGYSDKTVDELVESKPFIMASQIMGSLLKTSMLNAKEGTLPKPCKVDILRQLREHFLIKNFTPNKQEDAHEFLTHFLDNLESECPNSKLSCATEECRKRKCPTCDHDSDTVIESTSNVLLPINEITWNTGEKTSIQNLLNESYDGRPIISGSICPKCKEGGKTVAMIERTVLRSSSPELLLVVKRMNVTNGINLSNKFSIECDSVLTIPDMPHMFNSNEKENEEENEGVESDTKKKRYESYYLRSVVCHHGQTYESGHYYTMIVGRDVKSGTEQYFELNDGNHFSLTKERFFDTIKTFGYIFHFSQVSPGNLDENYKGFSSKSDYISKLSTTCQQAWRKKPPKRGDNRRISNNTFILKGQKQILLKDLYHWTKPTLEENSIMCSQCLCHDGIMCYDWDTVCTNCMSVFPTEMKSLTICNVAVSSQYGGHGLFANKEFEEGEFICRMMGTEVSKGKKGQYVVHIENELVIDASQSNCIAKYANHSCNPNCILRKLSRIESKGSSEYNPEVWISAAESIPKGVELTYNYGTSFVIDQCRCDFCQSKMI